MYTYVEKVEVGMDYREYGSNDNTEIEKDN